MLTYVCKSYLIYTIEAISVVYSSTYICWIHTDAMKKDARRKDFFNNILPLTLFVRVRKGCSRVACERELETEHKLQYFDPTVMTVTLCLSCSLRLPNRWTPNSIGVSESPFGRVWFSLPHLVSSCLEFYWQLLLGLELNWVK